MSNFFNFSFLFLLFTGIILGFVTTFFGGMYELLPYSYYFYLRYLVSVACIIVLILIISTISISRNKQAKIKEFLQKPNLKKYQINEYTTLLDGYYFIAIVDLVLLFLFNPISFVHLHRLVWVYIDLAGGAYLVWAAVHISSVYESLMRL